MLNNLWNWFKKEELELSSILYHFHSINEKLEIFIDKTHDKMLEKQQQAKALEEQALKHSQDVAQAAKVQLNIRNILGL